MLSHYNAELSKYIVEVFDHFVEVFDHFVEVFNLFVEVFYLLIEVFNLLIGLQKDGVLVKKRLNSVKNPKKGLKNSYSESFLPTLGCQALGISIALHTKNYQCILCVSIPPGLKAEI